MDVDVGIHVWIVELVGSISFYLIYSTMLLFCNKIKIKKIYPKCRFWSSLSFSKKSKKNPKKIQNVDSGAHLGIHEKSKKNPKKIQNAILEFIFIFKKNPKKNPKKITKKSKKKSKKNRKKI